MTQLGARMPAQVLVVAAVTHRGFEYLGCQPLSGGGMVARAVKGTRRLEAFGVDELDACWRLARVADGRTA